MSKLVIRARRKHAGLVKNSATRQNLLDAMHGEAFAYVKYMLFAEHARKIGRTDLARLFERTARVERFEHFAEEAELLGLVGSDQENLRNAINGESYEVRTMYREFAEQAAKSKEPRTSKRFSEIRNDEMGHLASFKSALKSL